MIENELKTTQWIDRPLEDVFTFFSEAKNLEKITPPQLNFKILQTSTESIEKNTLIDYKLRLHGIGFHWKTLISEFEKNEFFIDEQIKGPYKKWVHRHTFTSENNGTRINDHVVYVIPFGLIGNLFLKPYIKKELDKIFQYRESIIEKYFKD